MKYQILKEMRADYNEIVPTVCEIFGQDWNDVEYAFRNQLHEAMVRANIMGTDNVYIVNVPNTRENKHKHAKMLQVCVDPEKEIMNSNPNTVNINTNVASGNTVPNLVNRPPIIERHVVSTTSNTGITGNTGNTNSNVSILERIRFNIFG